MEMTIRKVTLLWKRASVSDGNIDQEEFYAQNKDVEEMMKRSQEEVLILLTEEDLFQISKCWMESCCLSRL